MRDWCPGKRALSPFFASAFERACGLFSMSLINLSSEPENINLTRDSLYSTDSKPGILESLRFWASSTATKVSPIPLITFSRVLTGSFLSASLSSLKSSRILALVLPPLSSSRSHDPKSDAVVEVDAPIRFPAFLWLPLSSKTFSPPWVLLSESARTLSL